VTFLNSLDGVKKRLKIAVLIRRFIKTGGAERYAYEVSQRLALRHDVHVFAQEWHPADPAFQFHRVPRLVEKPRFINQWHFSMWTRRHVGADFDIVHSYEMLTRFNVMTVQSMTVRADVWPSGGPVLRRWWTRFKTLTSPRLLAYLKLEKQEYAQAPQRRWIVPADYVGRHIRQVYNVPADRLLVAPSAVDQRFFAPPAAGLAREAQRDAWSVRSGEIVFLFVGTEFERKGLACLLRGFARMNRTDCRLVVAGGGNPGRYREMAAALAVGDRVRFAGLVDDIHNAYCAADVFVLPTLRDPCPLSPLEAMACGLPVILSGTRFNGTAEMLADGVSALLVEDPRDVDAMCAALTAATDPELRRRLAKTGRERARAFTWEGAASTAEAAYGAVLTERAQ
jgi:glycosyltransferase involved in cell wall biosynthesis